MFSDAGHQPDHGQFSCFPGLLIGSFAQDSLSYVPSWMSHKSKVPAKSVGAAKILAAFEATDEGEIFKPALSTALSTKLRLVAVPDLRELFTSLSMQRNSADKSNRANFNVTRYKYKTQNAADIFWIPGRVSPTNTPQRLTAH